MKQADDTRRVVIESLAPQIDKGRFPIKRIIGEKVRVHADIFCDGHDRIRAELLFKRVDAKQWGVVEMVPLVNDIHLMTFYHTKA